MTAQPETVDSPTTAEGQSLGIIRLLSASRSTRRKRRKEADKEWRECQRLIGERMKRMRCEAQFPLRGMARALECSAPFLSDLEAGRRDWAEKWIEGYVSELSADNVKAQTSPTESDL